jgi:diacylglycerol kinase (ATP)
MGEPFSVRARLQSFRYAGRGLRALLSSQHNAWIHAIATIVALLLGFLLRIGSVEWAVVVLAIAGVWTAEALNTAIESLCDLASPEFHPLVERAKDVAAGGVLVAALGSVAVAGVVFGPKLLQALG